MSFGFYLQSSSLASSQSSGRGIPLSFSKPILNGPKRYKMN